MKKILLVVLIILFIPVLALANNTANKHKPSWQPVITNGNISFQVDMNSPTIVNKSILSFWMNAKNTKNNTVLFSHMAFDPKSKMIHCTEAYLYDISNKKVVSNSKSPSPWVKIQPNSPTLAILKYIVKNHPMFNKNAISI